MNIVSVIVSYNPNQDILRLISCLKKQGVKTILVDNNSDNKQIIDELKKSNEATIIELSSNTGIANAQNIGSDYAIKIKAEFIVFFDQDSTIDDFYLGNILKDYLFLKDKGINIGTIGPRFIDGRYNFFYPALKLNKLGLINKISVSDLKEPLEVSVIISSGSLVEVEIFEKIGKMRDEFFIDFVDTEWCFRALNLGYKNYVSSTAIMQHAIGDDVIKIFSFNIPVHSPQRRYFRIRNLFYMYRINYIPKILTLKLMMSNFLHQVLLIVLKGNKLDYVKFYYKAILDGFKIKRSYK